MLVLATGYWMLDTGYSIFDAGYSILDKSEYYHYKIIAV